MSPTARSLAHLRAQGWTVDVVERWIPGANIRRDCFGLFDLIAIRPGETMGVQVASGSNVAARIRKLTEHPDLAAVRSADWTITIHGWRQDRAGKWVLRVVDLS